MKKNILKLSLLILFLTLISFAVINIFGKTYTATFREQNEEHETELTNESGEVEIIEEKKENNKYLIKVKSKKPGIVFLSLKYNDYQESKILYIHKSMIITDNTFFGKSTFSEIIPISLTIILAYSIFLLIKKYKESINANLYQYKNIAYLGIIIYLLFFTISIIISILNYQGLLATINDIINSASKISIMLFPVVFVSFAFVTISNLKLIIKEGLSLKNLFGLFLGIFICISTWLPDILYSILLKIQIVNIYNLNGPGPYIYNFFETLIHLTIAYLECLLFGTIILAIKSVRKKPKYNKDYIIILGCKIKKDGTLPPLLKGRVDKALEFRNKQLNKTGKDLIFIPSGGKGHDEIISEAEAMKKYLLSQGIKKEKIMIENKSKNTYENINFSNKIINNKNSNICFSTTNYHVLRAGLIATEQGIKMEGIGSNTKAYFWINAFIREFIGTLYSEKKKHILIVFLIIIVIIIMVGITYIANNI